MSPVVDDDEAIRQGIAGLLRSAGLQAATFASAEDFLGSLHLGTTGCLILDLRMAGMGGWELQQRLVASGCGFPIIVLTAQGDDDMRAKTLRVGAAAFFAKPVDGDVLLDAVRSALVKTRERRSRPLEGGAGHGCEALHRDER